MLLMLGVGRILLPEAYCGVRVDEGSSRSSAGVAGSGSKGDREDEEEEKGEEKDSDAFVCGVVGDGVAAVEAEEEGEGVDDDDDDDGKGPSLKKASNSWCSSAVAVGERSVGRLMRLYDRGGGPPPEHVLGRSGDCVKDRLSGGRSGRWSPGSGR